MVVRLLFTPALLRLPGLRNQLPLKRVVGVAGFSVSSMAGASEMQEVKLLGAENDNYGGVIVEMKEHMDSNIFASALRASITKWREQGKKGVWIKLPIEHANLVEAAVKEGFWYHHAEPNYLMLAYWIPKVASTLPANASHRVGVGAFIMNKKREILVVQENCGRFKGTGMWKLPTGVVNEGEDICAAAIREVKEETSMDVSELEAAKWMPFDEYAALPYVLENELSKYIVDICSAKNDQKYHGFSPMPTTSFFSDKRYNLYYNKCDLQDE